jgi:hypothetical protein
MNCALSYLESVAEMAWNNRAGVLRPAEQAVAYPCNPVIKPVACGYGNQTDKAGEKLPESSETTQDVQHSG